MTGELDMSKAFVKDDDQQIDDDFATGGQTSAVPAGRRNYMTPAGAERLRRELVGLAREERPKLVETISWAASNGDRSENGDYIYGKKRLREIDRRIRFLSKRLENTEIVDPAQPRGDRIFFGATVTVLHANDEEKTYSIVGIDETDPAHGRISWISPLGKCLLKAREGDVVTLQTPRGSEELEIIEVAYQSLD
jgi:transcription elongation factor GreB